MSDAITDSYSNFNNATVEVWEWMNSFNPHFAVYVILSPDNNVRGTNMGPTWGRQDPGGPHVGPMDLVIWVRRPGLVYTV